MREHSHHRESFFGHLVSGYALEDGMTSLRYVHDIGRDIFPDGHQACCLRSHVDDEAILFENVVLFQYGKECARAGTESRRRAREDAGKRFRDAGADRSVTFAQKDRDRDVPGMFPFGLCRRVAIELDPYNARLEYFRVVEVFVFFECLLCKS